MSTYPIGTPGQKWGKAEKAEWLAKQVVKRSYRVEVLAKVEELREKFDVERYASLSYDTERYPLIVIKTKDWHSDKPTALVTGGIHGYETSGVQGAIRFAETKMAFYSDKFNVIVVPCVSPWGYETINRWNPNAVDPNRSFYADSPAEESQNLLKLIEIGRASCRERVCMFV